MTLTRTDLESSLLQKLVLQSLMQTVDGLMTMGIKDRQLLGLRDQVIARQQVLVTSAHSEAKARLANS